MKMDKQNQVSDKILSNFIGETAQKFGIPGVAVGVWVDVREMYACHGVTTVMLLRLITSSWSITSSSRSEEDIQYRSAGRVGLDR